MVVLAASVCTHSGKPIISRQFKELTKDRVTALLSNFPTLLADSEESQYTAVEDEYVRYMYQPLEEFYVVLITNKHSNILQDIDTLHLVTQSITSILRNVDEKEIYENCFELLSTFDEIVCLGYKENLTSSQIVNFLEMDSHEERIQEIIERNKELEAAEASKKKAVELHFKETLKKNNNAFEFNEPRNMYPQEYNTGHQEPQIYAEEPAQSPLASFREAKRNGGMQLGKKPSGFSEGQSLLIQPSQTQRHEQAQEQYQQSSAMQHTQQQQYKQPQQTFKPQVSQIENNGILFTINEKYSAQISREGNISSAEVKGDLQIRINDPSLAHAKIELNLEKNNDVSTQYKTHPNVDKQLFNESSIIGLKDPSKPFPSNDQNLGVLRWKSVLKNTDAEGTAGLLPVVLTTWVNNNNDGTIGLTFEYEANPAKQVNEVNIVIPIVNATLESAENDNATLQFTDDGINVCLTDLLNAPSGSFEVLCKSIDDEESLFPMELSFSKIKQLESTSGLQVEIKDVVRSEDSSSSLPYDVYIHPTNENFYIV